jgi:hypothetical protein
MGKNNMRTTTLQYSSEDSSAWELILFFLATFMVLLLLAFWPLTKQYIPGLADPPVVQAMGLVQDVSYVGGLFSRTQVRTSVKTVLLAHPVEMTAGTEVERRSTPVSELLCIVASDRCFKIASR